MKFRLILFIGLFLAIYFSQPYQIFWTADNPDYHVTADPDIQIAAMQGGYIGRQICLSILALSGAVALFRRKGDKLGIRGPLGGLIAFFFVWACLTVIWADDQMLTAKRVVVLIFLGVGALAVAKHFTLREIAEFILVSGALTAASGVIANVLMGTFHPFDPEYRFGGVMHPNDQGICCGLFFISAIALADTRARRRSLYIALAASALIFLILTKSRTAFASAMLAVLIYASLRMSRKAVIGSIILLTAAICVSYLLVDNDLFTGVQKALFLGRMDESVGTLNSRLPLWEECAGYWSQRPFLGYGYNAFWTVRHYATIGTDQGWGMGSAHNGFIDLALGVGLVGAGAFIAAAFLAIVKARSLSVSYASAEYALVCVILIYILLANLFESIILLPHLATFVLYVLLLKIGLANREPDATIGRHDA